MWRLDDTWSGRIIKILLCLTSDCSLLSFSLSLSFTGFFKNNKIIVDKLANREYKICQTYAVGPAELATAGFVYVK